MAKIENVQQSEFDSIRVHYSDVMRVVRLGRKDTIALLLLNPRPLSALMEFSTIFNLFFIQ